MGDSGSGCLNSAVRGQVRVIVQGRGVGVKVFFENMTKRGRKATKMWEKGCRMSRKRR